MKAHRTKTYGFAQVFIFVTSAVRHLAHSATSTPFFAATVNVANVLVPSTHSPLPRKSQFARWLVVVNSRNHFVVLNQNSVVAVVKSAGVREQQSLAIGEFFSSLNVEVTLHDV